MPSFEVPLSSSPAAPSTPEHGREEPVTLGTPIFSPLNPSTTPLGPPPSSAASFTPDGPPPSSVYGSSLLGASQTPSKLPSFSKNKSQLPGTTGTLPDFSKFADSSLNGSFPPNPNLEEDFMQQSFASSQGGLPFDDTRNSGSSNAKDHAARSNGAGRASNILNSSISHGAKRPFGTSLMSTGPEPSPLRSSKRRKDSGLPIIAKRMALQLGRAPLKEPENFITGTEEIVRDAYHSSTDQLPSDEDLTLVSDRLCSFWNTSSLERRKPKNEQKEYTLGIGPRRDAPPLQKALFTSILLLRLHYQPIARGKQAFAIDRNKSHRLSLTAETSNETIGNPVAIPRVLLDWLDRNHNPWASSIEQVEKSHIPAAHSNFWDVVCALTSRGQFHKAISLLKRSKFQYATTAPSDGQADGYTDVQIQNITAVVNKVVQVLQNCPALMEDDWHITRNDWSVYRRRVEHALKDLVNFAEGRSPDSPNYEAAFDTFQADRLSRDRSHSQVSRKAESRVPWTIYQRLREIYGILLGRSAEITATAQDWLDAAISLTVWWEGSDQDEVSVGNLALTRKSLKQLHSQGQRWVDVDPQAAYLDRLALSFQRITNESGEDDYEIDSNNAVEVALASVLEGNVTSVLQLLRAWSLPVACSVLELATLGGWSGSTLFDAGSTTKEFDETDLMVLSGFNNDNNEHIIRRDSLMIEYAEALFERGLVKEGSDSEEQAGWHLALAILVRLGDAEMSKQEVTKLLKRLPLEKDQDMDNVLSICKRFNLAEEGRAIAEKYADKIMESTEDYGKALIYYSRAHNKEKTKSMIEILISLTLIHSSAYPPSNSIDRQLHNLIYNPQNAFEVLKYIDLDAARMLKKSIEGYASIRRFYDVRDGQVDPPEDDEAHKIRKGKACGILMRLVASCDHNIEGGLIDPHHEDAIPVDGLLILLGEALVFLQQEEADTITQEQCFILLRAVEDLQTVAGHIYERCDSLLQTSLASVRGGAPPASPRRLLRTVSSATSASSFSIVGSSLLDSQHSMLSNSNSNSDEQGLAKSNEFQRQARGWDWRRGVGQEMKGEDLLRILRFSLAKAITQCWIRDGD